MQKVLSSSPSLYSDYNLLRFPLLSPHSGTLLTTPQHTAIGAHPVSMPTYRAQGTPAYSYVPPHW